jgi:hypothetical protein
MMIYMKLANWHSGCLDMVQAISVSHFLSLIIRMHKVET